MSSMDSAQKVAAILDKAGFEAYIIGGAVRDLLLGREPKDFDLVTNATPDQLAAIKAFSKVKPVHPRQAYGVTLVSINDAQSDITFEVTTYRRDIEAHLGRNLTKVEFAHLEDDIQRRDFTINALALDPLNNFLIDEVDGLNDLDKKTIRFIGDAAERLKEDPLRLMRGLRIAHQLSFQLEEQTYTSIRQGINNGALQSIAVDRLRHELNLMLSEPHRRQLLETLDEMGALNRLLPEVTAGKGILQPPELHAEGDVFTHTLLAVAYLPPESSLRLIWATLLHDIGKVPTQSMPKSADDRIRFNNHFKVGAEMATTILQRFGFSKKFTAEVSWMIEMHMGIDDLPKMTPAHQASMMKHSSFSDLLELHKADAKATWQPVEGHLIKPNPSFSHLQEIYSAFRQQQKHPQPKLKDLGIDGNWLIKELGLSKGPDLGGALKKLEIAFLNGQIHSKNDAKKFLSS